MIILRNSTIEYYAPSTLREIITVNKLNKIYPIRLWMGEVYRKASIWREQNRTIVFYVKESP